MQQNMGSVMVDLLPLMIGAAVAPVPIIIVLMLLGNPGGLLKSASSSPAIRQPRTQQVDTICSNPPWVTLVRD